MTYCSAKQQAEPVKLHAHEWLAASLQDIRHPRSWQAELRLAAHLLALRAAGSLEVRAPPSAHEPPGVVPAAPLALPLPAAPLTWADHGAQALQEHPDGLLAAAPALPLPGAPLRQAALAAQALEEHPGGMLAAPLALPLGLPLGLPLPAPPPALVALAAQHHCRVQRRGRRPPSLPQTAAGQRHPGTRRQRDVRGARAPRADGASTASAAAARPAEHPLQHGFHSVWQCNSRTSKHPCSMHTNHCVQVEGPIKAQNNHTSPKQISEPDVSKIDTDKAPQDKPSPAGDAGGAGGWVEEAVGAAGVAGAPGCSAGGASRPGNAGASEASPGLEAGCDRRSASDVAGCDPSLVGSGGSC